MPGCPKCSHPVPEGSQFCHSCGASMTGAKVKNKQGPKKSSLMPLIAGAVAVIVLAGAVFAMLRPKEAPVAETPIDPNATSIAGAPPMPDWLVKADPLIKTEYMWASAHLDELQYIPCYCGCGHDGHTDNFACYYDRNQSGTITGYDGMSLS